MKSEHSPHPSYSSDQLLPTSTIAKLTPNQPRHVQAFAHALTLSDHTLLDNEVLSPSSPRSPSVPLDSPNEQIPRNGSLRNGGNGERWKFGPDNIEGGGRVEKLTATSDFAVSGFSFCLLLDKMVGKCGNGMGKLIRDLISQFINVFRSELCVEESLNGSIN